MDWKPLTIPFNIDLHNLFDERVIKCNNTKVIKLLEGYDFTQGVKCNTCCDVLPLYKFKQNISSKYGIELKECINCISTNYCQFSKIYYSTKSINTKKFGTTLDFDIQYLKDLWSRQCGLCAISYYPMVQKYGDGNPFNMSIERIDNNVCYNKSNIVLICTWLQVCQGYDLKPNECRELLLYDSENDGFEFDPPSFKKSTKLIKKEPTKTNPKRDREGNIITKCCTDCGERKDTNEYYTKGKKENYRRKSHCKHCDNKRGSNRKNTLRGFIQKLVAAAKGHAKHRSNIKSRYDTAGGVDKDLFDIIVELVIRQGGRCNYTGIPFQFKTHNKHSPSIDRLDNSKGYVRGNLQMIITPLNTRSRVSKIEFGKIKNNLINKQ